MSMSMTDGNGDIKHEIQPGLTCLCKILHIPIPIKRTSFWSIPIPPECT
uniref:Uncharacterized protein n=1 Tax=Rhizophora mucronata TaxID=61149 RepID=A0A2P2IQZ7_RHIMU